MIEPSDRRVSEPSRVSRGVLRSTTQGIVAWVRDRAALAGKLASISSWIFLVAGAIVAAVGSSDAAREVLVVGLVLIGASLLIPCIRAVLHYRRIFSKLRPMEDEARRENSCENSLEFRPARTHERLRPANLVVGVRGAAGRKKIRMESSLRRHAAEMEPLIAETFRQELRAISWTAIDKCRRRVQPRTDAPSCNSSPAEESGTVWFRTAWIELLGEVDQKIWEYRREGLNSELLEEFRLEMADAPVPPDPRFPDGHPGPPYGAAMAMPVPRPQKTVNAIGYALPTSKTRDDHPRPPSGA